MVPLIKRAFQFEITKPDDEINLANAALLFAQYVTQQDEADFETYLNRLDYLAEDVRLLVDGQQDELEILETFNDYIFGELGLRGDDVEYYNPENSFLNKVLDSGSGIPITLSVIYLELGWRLGLSMWGISLPRHFIVGYGRANSPAYVDVFNQGQLLDEDDCLTIAQIPFNHRPAYGQKLLRPVDKKSILYRMLLNLKHIYVQRKDWQAAYNAVDLMLLLRPNQIDDLRDRGLIAFRLSRLHDSIFDLERYLFLTPKKKSYETKHLRRQIDDMEQKLLHLN